MKHTIPLGTAVSFDGDSHIYIVTDYQTLLVCDQPCDIPHESDCFDEPYITVKREIFTSFPLSKLRMTYDAKTHLGKPYKMEVVK